MFGLAIIQPSPSETFTISNQIFKDKYRFLKANIDFLKLNIDELSQISTEISGLLLIRPSYEPSHDTTNTHQMLFSLKFPRTLVQDALRLGDEGAEGEGGIYSDVACTGHVGTVGSQGQTSSTSLVLGLMYTIVSIVLTLIVAIYIIVGTSILPHFLPLQ